MNNIANTFKYYFRVLSLACTFYKNETTVEQQFTQIKFKDW